MLVYQRVRHGKRGWQIWHIWRSNFFSSNPWCFCWKKALLVVWKNQNSSLKLFTMGNILANPGPMGIPSLLNMIISKYFVYLKGRIKITGYPPNQSASTRPCSDLRRSIVAKQPCSKELVVSNSNNRCCLWTGRPIFIPYKEKKHRQH